MSFQKRLSLFEINELVFIYDNFNTEKIIFNFFFLYVLDPASFHDRFHLVFLSMMIIQLLCLIYGVIFMFLNDNFAFWSKGIIIRPDLYYTGSFSEWSFFTDQMDKFVI